MLNLEILTILSFRAAAELARQMGMAAKGNGNSDDISAAERKNLIDAYRNLSDAFEAKPTLELILKTDAKALTNMLLFFRRVPSHLSSEGRRAWEKISGIKNTDLADKPQKCKAYVPENMTFPDHCFGSAAKFYFSARSGVFYIKIPLGGENGFMQSNFEEH